VTVQRAAQAARAALGLASLSLRLSLGEPRPPAAGGPPAGGGHGGRGPGGLADGTRAGVGIPDSEMEMESDRLLRRRGRHSHVMSRSPLTPAPAAVPQGFFRENGRREEESCRKA
jgi:hypothetical protein